MALETPKPEYRQVAARIRAAITSGEFGPGSTLPAEPELADRYGTTRATVNRALIVLKGEGLVKPVRGRGTTVNEMPIIVRNTIVRQSKAAREAGANRGAFDAMVRDLGLEPRSVVTITQVSAPDDVAELLAVGEGELVLARAREMFANDTLVTLATSYLPLDIAAGTQLAEPDTGPGGAYSRLADLGHAPVEFDEEVTVRPPTDAEARALGMDPDQRVFDIVRAATDAAGRVVEVNKMVMPAHQFRLKTHWNAD